MTMFDIYAKIIKLPIHITGLSLTLAAAMLAFDLSLPLGVAGAVPYVALVLIGLWSPWRHYVLVLAMAGTVLTGLGYLYSPVGGVPWVVLTNRCLALFAIWTVAGLFLLRGFENLRLKSHPGKGPALKLLLVPSIMIVPAVMLKMEMFVAVMWGGLVLWLICDSAARQSLWNSQQPS